MTGKKSKDDVKPNMPSYEVLYNAIYEVIEEYGWCDLTTKEIDAYVAEKLQLSDDVLEFPHNTKNGIQGFKFNYMTGWARSHLKNYGVLDNNGKGSWWIVDNHGKSIPFKEKEVRGKQSYKKSKSDKDVVSNKTEDELNYDYSDWEKHIVNSLLQCDIKKMNKIISILLKKIGVDIKQSKISIDNKISGNGVLELNDIMSLRVSFMFLHSCSSINVSSIRSFRDSLVNNTNNGIMITLGEFSETARKEAISDTKDKIIELIDGRKFIQLLRKYDIVVEDYTVYKIKSGFLESL